MDWKKVLKLDRVKLENLDDEEERIKREQDHLDGRREKREKMGLKGNMSFPRKRRKHRGGRGRLGDTKLLPLPKKRT
tara:strand:+ start:483 stop:713 length:231 start_codon:yes stop_codon:yes gene_type:complete